VSAYRRDYKYRGHHRQSRGKRSLIFYKPPQLTLSLTLTHFSSGMRRQTSSTVNRLHTPKIERTFPQENRGYTPHGGVSLRAPLPAVLSAAAQWNRRSPPSARPKTPPNCMVPVSLVSKKVHRRSRAASLRQRSTTSQIRLPWSPAFFAILAANRFLPCPCQKSANANPLISESC